MKQIKGKPTKWQWALAAGMTLAGLLLMLPFFPEAIHERLSPILTVAGSIVLVMLFYRKEKYDDLPLAEQKERDREDRDERNQMLFEKTSWLCWQGETILFVAAFIISILFIDSIDRRIWQLFLLFYWIRSLIFELIRWLMSKKY